MITEKDFEKPFIKQKIEETKKLIENEIIQQFKVQIYPLNMKDECGVGIAYVLKDDNVLLKGYVNREITMLGQFKVSKEDLRIEAETKK